LVEPIRFLIQRLGDTVIRLINGDTIVVQTGTGIRMALTGLAADSRRLHEEHGAG
jgi:hypothetical protein